MEGKKLGAPDPIPGIESTARAPPQSPPAGNVAFRILCHVSQAGDVIGRSAKKIKQLKESTQSQIWVETAPSDSLYRVITIIGHVGSRSRVHLGSVTVNNASNREKEEQEQEVEVSRAQDALIRVFEVLNAKVGTSSTVSCRLLMEASRVGTVMGKGGELREIIRKETGCNVVIYQDNLPSCADPGDVMVKIDGNVLAVKKALVSISSRLQACPPIIQHRYTETVPGAFRRSRTMDVVPREASYRPPHYREFDPRDSLHRHVGISQQDALGRSFGTSTQPMIDSLSHRSYVRSLTASASENLPVTIKQPLSASSKDDTRSVALQILCSKGIARGVIGHGGNVIKSIRSETGASINVENPFPDCDERVITIIASENPKDQNSPAQRAIILVFSKMYEISLRSSLAARLVVRSRQTSCLLGDRGCIISELKKRTGAFIEVLKVGQNPRCVTGNSYQVVQISGEFSNVKDAINQVTSKLREDQIKNSFQRGSHYSVNYSNPVDVDPCIRPQDPFPDRFSPTAGYAPNTNRTVEFRVSENAVNSVFGDGENGHNRLQDLKEISGARVIIREPRLGTSDWIIAISGTPYQIQAAEDRLQALFLW